MLVPSSLHFLDLIGMPVMKCLELILPAQGFGVMTVSFLPLSKDRPDGVQFPVLAQQVLAA